MIPIPVDGMLEMAGARIDEIKTAAGVEPGIFRAFYQPVLRAFSEAVQQLPLAATVYGQPRGAFEFGLYTATVALRYAASQMFFPDIGSEERRILEPQCRYAAYVATLASVVAMISNNALIESTDRESEYHALVCPVSLNKWLAINPDANFTWRNAKQPLSAAEGAAIAARFIPTGLLNNFDIRVSLMIFGAIAPQLASNDIETTLARVVRQSIAKVAEHYIAQDKSRYNENGNSLAATSPAINGIAGGLIQATKQYEPVDLNQAANAPGAAQDVTPTSPAAAQVLKTPAMTQAPIAPEPRLEFATKMLESAPKEIKEWFAVLPTHEKYETLKTHLVVSEAGIAMPAAMLGSFGVSGPVIRKKLTDAGLIIGRTEDGRGVLLHGGLAPLLQLDAA